MKRFDLIPLTGLQITFADCCYFEFGESFGSILLKFSKNFNSKNDCKLTIFAWRSVREKFQEFSWKWRFFVLFFFCCLKIAFELQEQKFYLLLTIESNLLLLFYLPSLQKYWMQIVSHLSWPAKVVECRRGWELKA